MDLTVQLLTRSPQPVRGQHWRAERMVAPTVAEGSPVRLDHGQPPVGTLRAVRWEGDRLMATATIEDRHADRAHAAVTRDRRASIEYVGGEDRDLLGDVMHDGGSCMTIRGTTIVGVALGQARPLRDDTMVVGPIPTPPKPKPATRAHPPSRTYTTEEATGPMRYAGGGHVTAVR